MPLSRPGSKFLASSTSKYRTSYQDSAYNVVKIPLKV